MTPSGPERVERQPYPHRPAPTAARGSLALIVSFVVIAALNYGFAILMSWLLPLDQFGMLGVVQAILLLGTTAVNAGFPWALTQSISERPAGVEVAGAFRGALVGNLALGLVIGGALAAGSATGWLGIGVRYQPLLLLTGITIAVLAVLAVLSAVLQGFLRLDALGTVRALEVAVKFAAGAALVVWGAGALGAVGGFLIGAVVAVAVAAFAGRDVPVWHGRGWGERRVYARAGPFFAGMFALTALLNADIIGLKAFSPPDVAEELAGQYQAAVTLARIPVFVTTALASAVFPFVAQHAARAGRGPSAQDAAGGMSGVYARLAVKYTLLFIVPVNVMFVIHPETIMRTFFSAAYEPGAQPLAIAAAGTALLSLIHALAMLLQASGRVWRTALVLSAGVVVQVVALWWLVPALQMRGAALSLVIAGGPLALALLVPAMRVYGLGPSVRQTAAYLAALGALTTILWLAPHGSRPATLATLLCGGGVYVLALAVLGAITERDVEIVAGGLGPRWAGVTRRAAQLVHRLNVVPPAGGA